MKILCLQLARFGDIYQSWPALSALRRKYPEATIDLLVRERFVAATKGITSVNRVITLPTKNILEPLFATHPRLEDAIAAMTNWFNTFSKEDEPYDRICNLSFSPVSSYMTDILAGPRTVITGYSRFTDGFLNIVDDASSYFYAQVGTDRTNRIHVTDLFALVAGVELTDGDLIVPQSLLAAPTSALPAKFVVLHAGASAAAKRCTSQCWQMILDQILAHCPADVVLVGAEDEDAFMSAEQKNNSRIINLTGKTELSELFAILSRAEALLGADSVAIHMASLTQTPTLNISFSSVRFWETGPRAKKSRVVWFETPATANAERIVAEFSAMLEGKSTGLPAILKEEDFGVLYRLVGYQEDDFSWELTRALYMSKPFPVTTDISVAHAFQRLNELALLGLEQIRIIRGGGQRDLAVSILDQIDHLLTQVDRFVPSVGPVVRWFQAEKCRIGPGKTEDILNSSHLLFQKLGDISQLYSINQKMNDVFERENLSWKS